VFLTDEVRNMKQLIYLFLALIPNLFKTKVVMYQLFQKMYHIVKEKLKNITQS